MLNDRNDMKKIFNIFAAALMSAAVLTSCAEKEIVTYDPDNTAVPALEAIADSYVLEDGGAFATFTFSAAEFGIATAARYTLYADVNEDFSSKKSLGNVTTDTVGITVTANTLNNALMSLNCEAGVPVTVYFRMEAEMMGESAPVGSVEALVSNAVTSSITPFNAEKTYEMIYVAGTWNDWSQTSMLFCYNEDGNTFEGVLDFGADYANSGFKLCPEPNWDAEYADPNSDGSTTTSAADAASMTLVTSGGGNIINYRSHRYYNFCFTKSDLTFKMIKSFDLVTVAGAFNGWATDATPMEQISSNGKFYVDIDVDEAGAADGFKFVLDNGGTWLGPNEIEGAEALANGNIALEPGQYRFYLDLNDWDNITYSLSTADYGKPVDGGSDTPDEPEDPEDPEDPDQPELQENLWGVIGTFAESNWSADIYMTEFPAGSGIWISPVLEFADTTQFKLRFNNDWNTQAGAVAAGDTLRTGIPTVAGFGNNVAQNVGVAKEQVGKRVVVYDAENNQLYLLGWSVIGAISGDSWGHDFPMIFDPEANTWSVSGLSVEGAFKLRWAGQWSTSEVTIPDRGLADGASFAVGTPISLKQGGGDINPGENVGTYNMVYDVANETLTLKAAE